MHHGTLSFEERYTGAYIAKATIASINSILNLKLIIGYA